jgi:hypothetical protein
VGSRGMGERERYTAFLPGVVGDHFFSYSIATTHVGASETSPLTSNVSSGFLQ